MKVTFKWFGRVIVIFLLLIASSIYIVCITMDLIDELNAWVHSLKLLIRGLNSISEPVKSWIDELKPFLHCETFD